MKFLLMMVGAIALPAFAADLKTDDVTGVTFWLAVTNQNLSLIHI